MKISELIEKLEKIKTKHGDLPVVTSLFDEEELTNGLVEVTEVRYLAQEDVDSYNVYAYHYDNDSMDCVKIEF